MGNALEEHYGYLSDAVRRERFEQAIARAVKPGDTVADVGCGFGIFGLMCLEGGASHIWGIDRSDAIEIARETMRRNGLADRFTCLHETSFEAELPAKVDVVICDHVGYFGFDYGIIGLLDDARRRFLKPGGTVLPAQIVLQAAAAQSSGCRKLADAWTSNPIHAEYAWLREYAVNARHPYEFKGEELASAAADLGTIDLRRDSPEHFSFSAKLAIERACELDGLAGWFACELANDVWMTNSPLAPGRINRQQVFLPFAAPLTVIEGDTVEVTVAVRHDTSLTSWSARVLRTGQSARQSTWASTILDPLDRIPPGKRRRQLTPKGKALQSLLAQVDGQTPDAEIESAVVRDHPNLYPSRDLIGRFVRSELHRNAR
jgi:protein arginine N-methyltransferase 1